MCFNIHSKHPNSYVKRSHVLCWKELHALSGQWVSRFRFMPYTFGEIVSSSIVVYPRANVINEGLHSYSTKRNPNRPDVRAFPALIPAGTQFYYDPLKRELVSTHLVVFKDLRSLKRYATTFTTRPRRLR